MQDHQDIPVTILKPLFHRDRSHAAGDVVRMGEEAAVREGLAGSVEYDFNALSERAKAYLLRLKNPVVGGHPVAY
jgi:hypothetical protein